MPTPATLGTATATVFGPATAGATAIGAAALPALLLLADGRLPAGGHAHSAGIEAAVDDGRVRGMASLEDYARGRLWTTGLTDAALAAAAALTVDPPQSPFCERLRPHVTPNRSQNEELARLVRLDREADARIVAPPLRDASRRLGRQLVRVASKAWPAVALAEVVDVHPAGPHQSVATGAVAVAAGLGPDAAAAVVVHHAIATPTQAAVKLLGLDPYEVTALAARLADDATEVTTLALAAAHGPVEDLPALTGPLIEIAAVEHHARPVRMFAS